MKDSNPLILSEAITTIRSYTFEEARKIETRLDEVQRMAFREIRGESPVFAGGMTAGDLVRGYVAALARSRL